MRPALISLLLLTGCASTPTPVACPTRAPTTILGCWGSPWGDGYPPPSVVFRVCLPFDSERQVQHCFWSATFGLCKSYDADDDGDVDLRDFAHFQGRIP